MIVVEPGTPTVVWSPPRGSTGTVQISSSPPSPSVSRSSISSSLGFLKCINFQPNSRSLRFGTSTSAALNQRVTTLTSVSLVRRRPKRLIADPRENSCYGGNGNGSDNRWSTPTGFTGVGFQEWPIRDRHAGRNRFDEALPTYGSTSALKTDPVVSHHWTPGEGTCYVLLFSSILYSKLSQGFYGCRLPRPPVPLH
jgi:hypothetical protein